MQRKKLRADLRKEWTHVGAYWRWSKLFAQTFRALSYMPFEEIDDDGDLQFTFRSWLWTVGTAAIQVTILYFGIIYRVRSPQFWENYLKVLENILRFGFICTIPPLISSWYSTPLLLDYLKEWRSFEESYMLLSGQCSVFFKQRTTKYYLIFIGVLSISLPILDQYMFNGTFNLWLVLPYVLAAFYTASICSYWVFHCIFIAEIVKHLKRNIVQTLSCCPDAKTLRSQRLLWLRLQHLTAQLPVVFSAPLITQLLMYFLTYVFSSYSLIRSIDDNALERIVGFSSPHLWCIIVFMSLNESSYYLGSQVGRLMLVSMLNTRTQSLSLDARRELILLIDSIERPLDMELSGCFTLGRSLAIQVARTSLTYLIVLSQFDNSAA